MLNLCKEKLNEQKLASAALSTIKEESEQASKVEIDKYSSLKKKVFECIRFCFYKRFLFDLMRANPPQIYPIQKLTYR